MPGGRIPLERRRAWRPGSCDTFPMDTWRRMREHWAVSQLIPEKPMKRMPIPHIALAVALALLLPLEQAHCAWMGLQKHAAPVAGTATSAHACCASPVKPAPSQPAQGGAPAQCMCQQLPPAAMPATPASGGAALSVMSLAALAVPSFIAPVPSPARTVLALDVGSPPLPDDPGAHGLRAPPVSS
jgi:hypothetical protein